MTYWIWQTFVDIIDIIVIQSAGQVCPADENWKAFKYETKLNSKLKEGSGMWNSQDTVAGR